MLDDVASSFPLLKISFHQTWFNNVGPPRITIYPLSLFQKYWKLNITCTLDIIGLFNSQSMYTRLPAPPTCFKLAKLINKRSRLDTLHLLNTT